MPAVTRDNADQYRVRFDELDRGFLKRGPVAIDPYLIARAVAAVMKACTMRAATGKRLLWNQYRVILARPDHEALRGLELVIERDLKQALVDEARSHDAEMVGALRITLVVDEADELPAGEAVVRVGFVPTERLPAPLAGEMTVRGDDWIVAGEIVAKIVETVGVPDTSPGGATVSWPGGRVAVPVGRAIMLGRPHDGAPVVDFIALAGASAKINKQHAWIAVAADGGVRVGRFASANPVHVGGAAVAAGGQIDARAPVEISLSRGELVLVVTR